MVVDRLRGDAEFGGDLLVRHPHPAAHLEDAARLFGQTGERFVVQTRQLGTEIEVGGFETFGEALAQLLVDALPDLPVGDAVERLVADDHKEQPFERQLFEQFVAVFPDVEHRVLHDVLGRRDRHPTRRETAQAAVIEFIAGFEAGHVAAVEPADDCAVVVEIVFGLKNHRCSLSVRNPKIRFFPKNRRER